MRPVLGVAAVALGMLGLLGCTVIDPYPTLPLVADPCATWPVAGTYRLDLGEAWDRQPIVVVPADIGVRDAIVMLHGAGGDGQRALDTTSWKALAGGQGWVTAFPNGTGTTGYTWNAGSCCGYAENVLVEDVAFLDAVAAGLRDQLCIGRVVAAGYSNGAMMANRWSCESDATDATLTYAGPLMVDRCRREARPTLWWHGSADTRVPYDGGLTVEEEVFPPVEASFAEVRRRNGCDDTSPDVTTVGDVTCESWRCTQPTTFCKLDGATHAWAGDAGAVERGGPGFESWAFDWLGTTPADSGQP
jgi:polyhydroxybutyrate depolymerase